MIKLNEQTQSNQIISDDLALAAYLKMKGYRLTEFHHNKSKIYFTFDLDDADVRQLKTDFVNSDFLVFYNELRNLKKIM
ncbi:MAG: hypothetical protein GXO74_10680 [Calditrichaeota bacterium]|nr:hypothetical protein [Calditrichota bacterium]